jgi:hypothetical protein
LDVTKDLPFVAVIRLSDVKPSREDLGAWLGCVIDRFERSRRNSGFYAQVDLADGPPDEIWNRLQVLIDQTGPNLKSLRDDSAIGATVLDVGFSVGEFAVISRSIPAEIVASLGRYGIGLEVSFYASST